MRNFIIVLVGVLCSSLSLASNLYHVKCSIEAGYEIYKGEGMTERSQGSLIATPVEFAFFTNEEEFNARFPGGYASLSVKAVSSDDEAKITVTGGREGTGMNIALVFHPRRGGEVVFTPSQAAAFNYTGLAGRISFTRATLRCLPAVLWDQRPVIK